ARARRGSAGAPPTTWAKQGTSAPTRDAGRAPPPGRPRGCRRTSRSPGRSPRCRAAARPRTPTPASPVAWCLLRARGGAIPRAANRLHEAIVPEILERLAQAADVHVDRALLDVHVPAPDAIEQLIAGIDALGVRHEEFEHA